ncbi:MAG: hypothetical protein KDC53_06215, partial [Saprospiraceae bacterium]|nr:hypothetical protein [Saprospiraceae bacterium]
FFPNLSSRYLTSAAGYYTAYGWAYASGPRQEPLDMEILTIPVFNWFDFPLFGRITLSDAA